MQTQKEIILNRLRRGDWFSTVECVQEFHILRLGARIYDLKQEGYEIEERKVEGRSYSQYRLRRARTVKLPPAFGRSPETSQQGLF
jgi:Helix-turn-helix domain